MSRSQSTAHVAAGALDAKLEFLIPVYSNMPDYPASPPTNHGSRNNYLREINVDGVSLAAFNPETYHYDLEMAGNKNRINVSASAFDGLTYVEGIGNYTLQKGENVIALSGLSESGHRRIYLVTINYTGTVPETVDGGLAISGNGVYQLKQGNVYGADPLTGYNTSARLKQYVTVNSGYTTRVVDSAGNPTDGVVGTGARIEVLKGSEVVTSYTVIILGDVNGDGDINVIDVNAMFEHVMGAQPCLAMHWQLPILITTLT